MPHRGSATALLLVSVGGTLNSDFAISGPVKATPFWACCPYLIQVLHTLDTPICRCRAVRLHAKTQISPQALRNYHWFRRFPLYIPIATTPEVTFVCGKQRVAVAAGEIWGFDHTQPHQIVNKSQQECLYLVIETKGSKSLRDLREQTRNETERPLPIRDIPYIPEQQTVIPLETYLFEVLTPQEIRLLTGRILNELEHMGMPQDEFLKLRQNIATVIHRWEKAYRRFGHSSCGELAYQDVIQDFKEQIAAKIRSRLIRSGEAAHAVEVICSMLLSSRPAPLRVSRRVLSNKKQNSASQEEKQKFRNPTFKRPIFIVSVPRAGSTLLFDILSRFPNVWTIGEESHETIEGIAELHPSFRNYTSNRLTEDNALPHIASHLQERFTRQLMDGKGRRYVDIPDKQRPTDIRFLEKTPKNALRIPFLKALFPDALFLYLYRDAPDNINSLMEGWRSHRFIAYQGLPDWPYRDWSFLLVPGWQALQDCSVAEIAAYQWKTANAQILEDLDALSPSSWRLIRYVDIIRDTKHTIKAISKFAGLEWNERLEGLVSHELPVSHLTLSAPSPEKWRKHEHEITTVLPDLNAIRNRLAEEKGC